MKLNLITKLIRNFCSSTSSQHVDKIGATCKRQQVFEIEVRREDHTGVIERKIFGFRKWSSTPPVKRRKLNELNRARDNCNDEYESLSVTQLFFMMDEWIQKDKSLSAKSLRKTLELKYSISKRDIKSDDRFKTVINKLKKKYQSAIKHRIFFQNEKDNKQCIQIMNAINKCELILKLSVSSDSIKQIAQFATGNVEKCGRCHIQNIVILNGDQKLFGHKYNAYYGYGKYLNKDYDYKYKYIYHCRRCDDYMLKCKKCYEMFHNLYKWKDDDSCDDCWQNYCDRCRECFH